MYNAKYTYLQIRELELELFPGKWSDFGVVVRYAVNDENPD